MIICAIIGEWVRPHGPMKILLSDEEGGLKSDEAAQWLDRWQIQVRLNGAG